MLTNAVFIHLVRSLHPLISNVCRVNKMFNTFIIRFPHPMKSNRISAVCMTEIFKALASITNAQKYTIH